MSEVLRQNCVELGTYTDTLQLSGSCRTNSGQPGRIEWTPDENTPDAVYYQVREMLWSSLLFLFVYKLYCHFFNHLHSLSSVPLISISDGEYWSLMKESFSLVKIIPMLPQLMQSLFWHSFS